MEEDGEEGMDKIREEDGEEGKKNGVIEWEEVKVVFYGTMN